MNNINQEDAYNLIINTINLLGGNLEHQEPHKDEDEKPKSEWLPQIIDGLKNVLTDLSDDEPEFNYYSYASFGYRQATGYLDDLIKELREDLNAHDNIRSDDCQYEDPQEWWLSPLVEKIEVIKNDIFWNAFQM